MTKKTWKLGTVAVAIASLGAISQAQAYTIYSGGTSVAGEGLVSSVLGTVTTDFNSGTLPGNYSDGDVKIGGSASNWASPPSDSTYYYSVGPSTSTPGSVSFAQNIVYFGFYWGSPDGYNSLELWRDDTQLLSLSGDILATAVGLTADGNQGSGAYVNIWVDQPSEVFNRVVFGSTTNAFETDNHATLTLTPEQTGVIPEPETYAMLLAGLGLMGFVARRRKLKLTTA